MAFATSFPVSKPIRRSDEKITPELRLKATSARPIGNPELAPVLFKHQSIYVRSLLNEIEKGGADHEKDQILLFS